MKNGKELFDVQRRIITGFILGKIQPREHQQSNPIFKVKLWLKMKIEEMGEHKYSHLWPDCRKVAHIIANRVFDKICNYDYLSRDLDSVSVSADVFIDKVVCEFCGEGNSQKRWNDDLWNLKKQIDLSTKLSISGVHQKDFRVAYDELVHAVVDDICDELKFGDEGRWFEKQ